MTRREQKVRRFFLDSLPNLDLNFKKHKKDIRSLSIMRFVKKMRSIQLIKLSILIFSFVWIETPVYSISLLNPPRISILQDARTLRELCWSIENGPLGIESMCYSDDGLLKLSESNGTRVLNAKFSGQNKPISFWLKNSLNWLELKVIPFKKEPDQVRSLKTSLKSSYSVQSGEGNEIGQIVHQIENAIQKNFYIYLNKEGQPIAKLSRLFLNQKPTPPPLGQEKKEETDLSSGIHWKLIYHDPLETLPLSVLIGFAGFESAALEENQKEDQEKLFGYRISKKTSIFLQEASTMALVGVGLGGIGFWFSHSNELPEPRTEEFQPDLIPPIEHLKIPFKEQRNRNDFGLLSGRPSSTEEWRQGIVIDGSLESLRNDPTIKNGYLNLVEGKINIGLSSTYFGTFTYRLDKNKVNLTEHAQLEIAYERTSGNQNRSISQYEFLLPKALMEKIDTVRSIEIKCKNSNIIFYLQ